MDIASLVLGIISIVFGIFPYCGSFFFLPALVGLILGIVFIATAKRHKKHRGMAIAGTTTSAIALIVMIGWWLYAILTANFTSSNNSNFYSSFNSFTDTMSTDTQQFDEDTIQWEEVEDSIDW